MVEGKEDRGDAGYVELRGLNSSLDLLRKNLAMVVAGTRPCLAQFRSEELPWIQFSVGLELSELNSPRIRIYEFLDSRFVPAAVRLQFRREPDNTVC